METKNPAKTDEINSLRRELETLRESMEEGIKKYNSILVQKDRYYKGQLQELEERYKKSWKWRIGDLFVESFIRVVNFLKNPVRFFISSEYRGTWNDHQSHSQIPGPIAPNLPLPINSLKNTEVQLHSTEVPQKSKPVAETKSVSQTQPNPMATPVRPLTRVVKKVVVAAVVDEFTSACFSPECNMVTFRPDNWKEKVEQQPPDVVFIESAWHGNQGSWQYKIAKYARNMGDELSELVAWAKGNHIPTVFWNKEDPPNFDRFIDKASFFETIFTSDKDCIPKYQKVIQHDRIYPLPFAAQPLIHNPIGEAPRSGKVCFAGTYHADEYFDRQDDMEIILNPSLEFGLHIYDRNFGAVGPGSERFRFPDKYQSAIQGRLNYEEMIKAYHQYRVFLNVNSVKRSPTMFSRRVFELLACGTPVISTYSRGILELLGDHVFITESESDTRKHLELLLNDHSAWMRASVAGIRKVMEFHTYNHRINEVFDKIGLAGNPVATPDITLLVRTDNEERLSILADRIREQTHPPKSVVLISEFALSHEKTEQFAQMVPSARIFSLVYFQDKLPQKIHELAPSGYYAIWDQKDFYGPNYLKDYALAVKYSDASYFGKSNYHRWDNGRIAAFNDDSHFRMVNRVPISTLMFKGDQLTAFNLGLMNNPEGIFDSFLTEILSLDPMNYIKNFNAQHTINLQDTEPYIV